MSYVFGVRALSDVSAWTSSFWKSFENGGVVGERFKRKMAFSDLSGATRAQWALFNTGSGRGDGGKCVLFISIRDRVINWTK